MKNILETIPNASSISQVNDFMENILQSVNVPLKISTKLCVAVDEIYSNVVHYSGAKKAGIHFIHENDCVKVIVWDDGVEFNPLLNIDPDTSLSAEERPIGGLGIYMTKQMMDSVAYEYKDNLNYFTMTKNIV